VRKIAFIIVSLVPESGEKPDEEIERDINENLAVEYIPWAREILKVTISARAVLITCKRFQQNACSMRL